VFEDGPLLSTRIKLMRVIRFAGRNLTNLQHLRSSPVMLSATSTHSDSMDRYIGRAPADPNMISMICTGSVDTWFVRGAGDITPADALDPHRSVAHNITPVEYLQVRCDIDQTLMHMCT
jgi:hypothetical protein